MQASMNGDCHFCDGLLTQEADGVFRHLADDGCSLGNIGFTRDELEAFNPPSDPF